VTRAASRLARMANSKCEFVMGTAQQYLLHHKDREYV
jgi:hypothetical protein